jgi:hypothetical protein
LPSRHHFRISAGEDRTLSLTARGSGGAILDLTTYSISWSMAHTKGGAPVLQKTGTVVSAVAGTFTISLTDSDTNLLKAGTYFHQALATAGATTLNVAEGNIQVSLENTGVLSSSLGAVYNNNQFYGSRAEAVLTKIGPSSAFLETFGYYTLGDGGGGKYKRVGAAPSANEYFQSADGAYWALAEVQPNVKQYGAKGDGTTNDTAAFQKAIDASLGVVDIPDGRWLVSAASLTGASTIYFRASDALNSGGSAPVALPGITDSIYNGRRTILHTDGNVDETALLQISRTTTYTGGTAGNVNTSLYVSTVTAGPETQNEWAGLFYQNNFATSGENVGLYAKAIKIGAGSTWALVAEFRDKNTDPTGSAVSLEVGLFANGTDTNSNRVAIDISIGKDDSGGTINTTSYGVRVGPQDAVAGAGKVKYGFAVTSTFDTAAFDASQGTQSSGAFAFKMKEGQKMAFDDTGARTWFYSSGSLVFQLSGVTKAAIDISSGAAGGAYSIQGSQIIGPRDTGWTAMTGTPNEATAYDTASVTTAQLAGRVMALQTALTTHGLIGT